MNPVIAKYLFFKKNINNRILSNSYTLHPIPQLKKELFISIKSIERVKNYVKNIGAILNYSDSSIMNALSNTKVKILDKPIIKENKNYAEKGVVAEYLEENNQISILHQNNKIDLQILLHEYGHAVYFNQLKNNNLNLNHLYQREIHVVKVFEEYCAKEFEYNAVKILGLQIEWKTSWLPNYIIEHLSNFEITDKKIESDAFYSFALDFRHAFAVLALESSI